MAILADDLIWATRLAGFVQVAGGTALPARSAAMLETLLPEVDAVIVDLTARAYDGVAAVRLAASGHPVLAVGQHDDRELRRRALDAGASKVYPYRRLFEDGPRQVAAWLGEGRVVEPTA